MAALTRERIRQWREATPVLEALREEDIRRADTARALECFRGMVLALLPSHPPSSSSGLVEQQRWFRKLREA